jgi:hypothetical protein
VTEASCRHLEVDEHGACCACGACTHDVVVNGVCYRCGADRPDVSVKPADDAVVPASRLSRRSRGE